MDIRVYFTAQHTFQDDEGNEYYTDEWQEDAVERYIRNEILVIDGILMGASEKAKYLIIDCKEYKYIGAEQKDTIAGLKLINTVARNIRYNHQDFEDISIPGEFMKKFK